MTQYLSESDSVQKQVSTAEELGDNLMQALNLMVDLMCVNYHSSEASAIPSSRTIMKLYVRETPKFVTRYLKHSMSVDSFLSIIWR